MARSFLNIGDPNVGHLASLVSRMYDALAGSVSIERDGNVYVGTWGSPVDWGAMAGYLDNVTLTVASAPTGAPIVVDVLYSTNGGSSYQSIWAANTQALPQIQPGQTSGASTSFPSGDRIPGGALITARVVSTGSINPGSGLTVTVNGGPF